VKGAWDTMALGLNPDKLDGPLFFMLLAMMVTSSINMPTH